MDSLRADRYRAQRLGRFFVPLSTRFVYCLCMATKTISIEIDAYDLLAQEKKDRTESFSRVIRRLFAERPAVTAGELLEVMQEFKGKGAGPRRKRR
jgi:predicted CopG family antitoxin